MEYIERAVDEINYKQAGKFDTAELTSVFQGLINISSNIFVLDIDVAETEDLLTTLRKYRVSRPNTRIIAVAVGRTPGDQTVAQLVNVGIYDIVAPNENKFITAQLEEKINSSPATYAEAVRWHTAQQESEQKNNTGKKEKKIREEIQQQTVIFQDKIIGTVVIAVGGTSSGIGTTHTAISMAYYLVGQKNKVALVELGNKPVLERLSSTEQEQDHFFRQSGIDFYPKNKKNHLVDVLQKNYNYVIIDLGVVDVNKTSASYSEMNRAHLPVLVCSSAIWRLKDIDLFLKQQTAQWKFCFNLIDIENAYFKEILNSIKKNDRKAFSLPYHDSFVGTDNTFLERILEPVIPKKQTKTSFIQRFKNLIKKKKKEGEHA